VNLTVYDREAIEMALYDLFANRTTRGEVEDALIDADYHHATRLVAAAIYREGGMDADDPAGSSHRARSASEAEPALRCEASARGVRRLITIHEPVLGLRRRRY